MKIADQILQQLTSEPHHQLQQIGLPSKSQLQSNDLPILQTHEANQPLILKQDFDCSPKIKYEEEASSPKAMLIGEPIPAINQEKSLSCVKKSKRDFVTPSRTPQPKSRTLLNSASNSTDFATPLPGSNGKPFNCGRWKKDEHKRFLEALKKYGREWKQVQQHVSTRSSTQARSHAQKFLSKLEKKNIKLQTYLQNWDPDNSDDNLMSDDEKQDNKLLQKSGSFLNPQQRKRMSKDQILERQEFQCNFMIRGPQMPPRLLKQRSSPVVPNGSIFMEKQLQLKSYKHRDEDDEEEADDEEEDEDDAYGGDYNQEQCENQYLGQLHRDQQLYEREQQSNILQSGSKNLLKLSAKKRSSRLTKERGKENSQTIRQSIITPPTTQRRKSVVSNQTEDDLRSVNSLFPSKNLEMQRRKSCKAQYSTNRVFESAVSPQVTSKKSRGQKNKYHKIRISNIHHQQENGYQVYHNQYQEQFSSEYQRNTNNDSNFPPEYQLPRCGSQFTPLTPQPINRSLLHHRKNCVPLNNGNGYHHVSTPPPPEPPHFQNLMLPPPQQQTSIQEPYHLSQSRSWIQMQNKLDSSYDQKSQQQNFISAIPAINSNYQYSIPPPPRSQEYFMSSLNGRNQQYESYVKRENQENTQQEQYEEDSVSQEFQQEIQGNQAEQHRSQNYLQQHHHHHHHHNPHHHLQQQQNQQMQSEYSQQYANRYRQDLGILRTNYSSLQHSRNHSQSLNIHHNQTHPLAQDLGQYYPSSSSLSSTIQAQQYMNFQYNNPYHQHHHHHHQFQHSNNQLIDSSQQSLYNPQYMMGLNNIRYSQYNNRMMQSNNNNNSSLNPDDSYPILQQSSQMQQSQQYFGRNRGHSFSDIPQGFKIPTSGNDLKNAVNNGDENDAREGADFNTVRSQKYMMMMMMGQDESIGGALNPYRVAYQGEQGTDLFDQYKYMEDEIAVKEH